MNDQELSPEELEAQAVAEQEAAEQAEAERLAAEEAAAADMMPSYVTAEQLAANNAQLVEQIKGLIQPGQQASPAAQQQAPAIDPRTPWQIAEAQAESEGNYNPAYVAQLALQIQGEQQQKAFDNRLNQLTQQIGGLVAPLVTNHAVAGMAGGDQALAAEIQSTMTEMELGPDALQNEKVRKLVLNSSRATLGDKVTPRKAMPGAAPASSSTQSVGAGPRGKLNAVQRKVQVDLEKQWGPYTDEMIREEWGIQ